MAPLPAAESRYAFACADGKVYSGHVFLADKLEISIKKTLVESESYKSGIQRIIFGDFDGNGEIDLAILRQDNKLQIWQLFQNEPVLRYESKSEDGFGKILSICVSKQKRAEIIVVTFSGWAFQLGLFKEKESR